MGAERKLVKEYDKDGDGRLNKEERQVARAAMKVEREKNPRGGGRGMFGGGPPGFGGPPGGGRGGPPGFGGVEEPAKPGPHVEMADVKAFPGKKLYDPEVLRTIFLEFEDQDWESAIDRVPRDRRRGARHPHRRRQEIFAGRPADFRGMSSYMGVREGHTARSTCRPRLRQSRPEARIGYKTLNLLNLHEDPTFLHTVLFFHIARNYIPAPKANFVRVVVNGESWGLYVNAQQFDKVLIAENYGGPRAREPAGNSGEIRGTMAA